MEHRLFSRLESCHDRVGIVEIDCWCGDAVRAPTMLNRKIALDIERRLSSPTCREVVLERKSPQQ
jgi:hypothetical protein